MHRPPNGRTVLVTGGCGFIGVNLARALLAAGYGPVAYDNFSTGRADDARAAGYDELIDGDIRDADALAAAAEGVYAIVHLAARTGVVDSVEDPRGDLEVNVAGTLNALLAARDGGAEAFVFASSGAPLGSVEPPGHEGLAPRPLSPYGASKLAGRGPVLGVRGLVRPGDHRAALHQRLRPVQLPQGQRRRGVHEADHGRRRRSWSTATATRRATSSSSTTCASAVLAVLDRRPMGELYQLGTGMETSVNELVELLIEIAGTEIEVVHEPARAGEMQRRSPTSARRGASSGYDPSTPLADGLRDHLRLVPHRIPRVTRSARLVGGGGGRGRIAAGSSRVAPGGAHRELDRRLGDLVVAGAMRDVAIEVPTPSGSDRAKSRDRVVIAALQRRGRDRRGARRAPDGAGRVPGAPIVVVDGGTDDTAVVARRRVHDARARDQPRSGRRVAHRLRVRARLGATIVMTMDADGQHRPDQMIELVEPILAGEADYVQGSRFLGEYDDAGGARDVGIRGFTALINAVSGAGITDCTNGFRAIRASRARPAAARGAALLRARAHHRVGASGLRIREVPVHIRSRAHGESKKPAELRYPLGFLGVIVRTWRR